MQVRRATEQDLDTMVFLRMEMRREVAAFVPAELEQGIRRYLMQHIPDDSCICALLEVDGAAIGQAMLCCSEQTPDEQNQAGRYAALFSVYIRPEYRGHGYMRVLLPALLAWAKEQGIGVVTASAEEKAVGLYESLGFQMAEHEMRAFL